MKEVIIRDNGILLDKIKEIAKLNNCSMHKMIIYLLEQGLILCLMQEYEDRKIKGHGTP